MKQVNVAMPEQMYASVRKRAKREGFRSVQEYMLQAIRDKWLLDNLPRYERLAKELDEGKGTRMTIEEFNAWNEKMRKSSGK